MNRASEVYGTSQVYQHTFNENHRIIREKEAEVILEKMARNSPNLMKNIILHILGV